MAHASLVSLNQTIDQIRNQIHSPIFHFLLVNEDPLMDICNGTHLLKTYLPGEEEVNTDLEDEIREVANMAEDVIEDVLLDYRGAGVGGRKLKQLADRMKAAATGKEFRMTIAESWVDGLSKIRLQKDRVVGFERDLMLINNRKRFLRRRSFERDLMLINERLLERPSSSSGLEVLPIVGMGGIGKTTLAKLFYDSQDTRDHFDVRGWVTVSQDYSVSSVVSSLVASMEGSMKLAGVQEIQDYLRGKRYLIVLDDIWSKRAWDDVRKLLPDNDHGSAIVLTTRNQDIAVYANHPSSSTSFHTVQPLDPHSSWILLQIWAFGDLYTCPEELQSIGRSIAGKCRGLPLSISVVGGLLSAPGFATTYMWERIRESSDGQVEKLISLSYTHLPQHLKSCFLYMGGFPEDYQIHASELIRLWVAEGFVSNGYEDEAEGYLEDLIDRGLVLDSSRKLDGKVKRCSLHDVVRDFCIRQGRREKLLVPVMDYLPTPILRRHFLSLVLKNYKRISTAFNDLHLPTHTSRTHSIISIPQKAGYKRATTSLGDFRLLRVLHVVRKDDYCDWEPSHDVFDLVYLTYLASNIPSTLVPPVISKLQNLQSLILYKSEVRLPVEIWGLRRLRHLIAFSFLPLPHPEKEALPLEKLQILTCVTDFVCSERMVEMIPNVKKLGICYSAEPEPGTGPEEGFFVENLLQLEELKLYNSTSIWASRPRPVFPKSLKKLVLSEGRVPWRDMTKVVGRLPLLQVLKLKKYACEGEEWVTYEGEFDSLRVLVIDQTDLRHWITDGSHFPMLEHLMLHRCPHLSELPTGRRCVLTLETIEIDGDNQSLLYLAQMIRWEQKDLGLDRIQIRVKRF